MSYPGIGSGNTQTNDERVAEVRRILTLLDQCDCTSMSDREVAFIADMEVATAVEPKQLWWLRDLKTKYGE